VRNAHCRLFAVLVIGLSLGCAGTAAGATWHVYPCDTIQVAVDAAIAGDTIYVHAGTYVENVDVDKRVKLIGDGADMVTVRTADASEHVRGDRVLSEHTGFTVTRATDDWKAGIYPGNGIEHCNIFDNNA